MYHYKKSSISKKKIIGMVHGVFDIIHFGHILYFEEAKSKVDYLIVSITSDQYVNKGPGKPIFTLKKRMKVLESIKSIDEVIISDNKTAIENINKEDQIFISKVKIIKILKTI